MKSNDGVLILTEGFRPNIGGVETFLDHLVSFLLRRGYRIYVLTYQPLISSTKGTPRERSGALEVRRLSWFGHGWRLRLERFPPLLFLYLFPGLFFWGLFFMLVNGKRVKAIHAQSLTTTVIAVILGWFFRKRVISTTHTILRLEERKILGRLLRPILTRGDSYAVIAPAVREELMSVGVPGSKIQVFTHWVDLELYRPLDKRECQRALGLEGRFVFLFVGRFHSQKNVHLILDVATLLREEPIAFVFVGEGTLKEDILRAAQANPKIVHLGVKRSEELAPIYSAADLYWGDLDVDYLSRVTIEAFACGAPVLAPSRINILGVTQEVKPEAFSAILGEGILRLVEPTPEAVAQAIRDFRRTYSDGKALSARCRHYAEEFHSESNGEVIERAYRGGK